MNPNPHKEPMRTLVELLAKAGWITKSSINEQGVNAEFSEEGRIKLSTLDALFELDRPLSEQEQKCLAALIKEYGFPRP